MSTTSNPQASVPSGANGTGAQSQEASGLVNSSTFPQPSRRRTFSEVSAPLRSASIKLMETNIPAGMWSATGGAAARAPTLSEIRRGSSGDGMRRSRSTSNTSTGAAGPGTRQPQMAPVIGVLSESPHRITEGDEPKAEQVRQEKKANTVPGTAREVADVADDLPDALFGGEMSNQTFVKGSRSLDGVVTGKKVQPETSEALEKEDDNDSDLDELDPKPRRTSKNLDAFFGKEPDQPPSLSGRQPYHRDVDNALADQPPDDPQPDDQGYYPNGYHFPPKKTWGQATLIGLKALGRFSITPLGFLVVVYGLNVVAWGGMLFLLLCNASPAMCSLGPRGYDCNDIDSPRRIWIEIDSQILNALFCVTGFGLAPWRFRDLWYLLKFRAGGRIDGLRKLAGYHRGWFRLPGSDRIPIAPAADIKRDADMLLLDPALPLPASKAPSAPLTGRRAPPTAVWKMDFFVWAFIWNTLFQICLSAFMWRLNRYDRPSWSTGLFVALACIVAGCGGLMQFFEGKRIKSFEGVPLDDNANTGTHTDIHTDPERGRPRTVEGTDAVIIQPETKHEQQA